MPLVCITGSSGQLGAEVSRQFAQRGWQTIGVDLLPGEHTTDRIDIRDRAEVRRLVSNADAVVHTAGLHAPHVERSSRTDFVTTNVVGTLNLLEAAAAADVRRFVFTSTTSVYGYALLPKDRTVWVTEDLTPIPRDVYDITKLAAEQLCQDISRREGLHVHCLRVCRYFPEPEYETAVYRLHRGADVRDVASAHVLAATGPELPDRFGIFNIAGPYPFREREMIELFERAPDVIDRHFPGAAKAFAMRGWTLPSTIDRVYVSRRAERLLGYSAVHGFEGFLQQMNAAG
jgi:UDP-glucose 4-epimerase